MLNIRILLALACSSLPLFSSGETNDSFQYLNIIEKSFIMNVEKESVAKNILMGEYDSRYDINCDGKIDSIDLYFVNHMLVPDEVINELNTPIPEVTEPPQTEPPITELPLSETTAEQTTISETLAAVCIDESVDDSDIISEGIDVSYWQGNIDWQKVKNAGISFAMIKAGEGTEKSDYFDKNISAAQSVGINCGIYWFSKATSSAEAELEAEACLKAVSGYKLEYPVVYDCEYRSLKNNPLQNDKAKLTDMVLAFLKKIQQNSYYAMFYTNCDFSEKYLEINRISSDFDIWFAGYTVSQPLMPCGMWQRSETGRVDGISSFVDLDTSYRNYPAKMKKYHLNGY